MADRHKELEKEVSRFIWNLLNFWSRMFLRCIAVGGKGGKGGKR
jgi:hypothetical protein